MKQLQSFQDHFAKKFVTAKVASPEALTCCIGFRCTRGHRCLIIIIINVVEQKEERGLCPFPQSVNEWSRNGYSVDFSFHGA